MARNFKISRFQRPRFHPSVQLIVSPSGHWSVTSTAVYCSHTLVIVLTQYECYTQSVAITRSVSCTRNNKEGKNLCWHVEYTVDVVLHTVRWRCAGCRRSGNGGGRCGYFCLIHMKVARADTGETVKKFNRVISPATLWGLRGARATGLQFSNPRQPTSNNGVQHTCEWLVHSDEPQTLYRQGQHTASSRRDH
jgi:hypothetical protein